MAALLVDVSPLKSSRAFRWLFVGQVGVQLSRQILVVTVPYQVFVLTDSSLMVGLVGLSQAGPLIVCSILGGAAADTFDRRRLLVVAHVVMATLSGVLAMIDDLAASVWPIFTLIGLNAGMSALESPARTAIIPSLVSRDQLSPAFALSITLNQTTQVVGPLVSGVLIVNFGVAAAYWSSAGLCIFAAIALIPLDPRPPQGPKAHLSFEAVVQGWRYLRSTPLLQQVMLVDLNAMIFGMPRSLFPILGTVVFGGDARTVGLLYSASGVGAVVGAVTTGWVSAVRRQGRAVLLAVCVYGLAIAGFGVARNLSIALALLAVSGAANLVSALFRTTILQLESPDHLRGRLTSVKDAFGAGGPRLGDGVCGALAELSNPRVALFAGGLATITGTILIGLRSSKSLWRYRLMSEESPLPIDPGASTVSE